MSYAVMMVTIPEGYCFYNTEDDFSQHRNKIIINIYDCLNLKHHSDRSRLKGCCNLNGCDGINKCCPHGHEVATEKSDCRMPHCMIFNKENVVCKE